MRDKILSELIKDKSTGELLAILKKWGVKSGATDPDILSDLIAEINTRQLTGDEQSSFDEILLVLSKTGETASIGKDEDKVAVSEKDLDDVRKRKYASIGRLKSQLYLVGVLLIVSSIILLGVSLNDRWGGYVLFIVFCGLGLGFVLFALSALLGVLVDIERNTRKE